MDWTLLLTVIIPIVAWAWGRFKETSFAKERAIYIEAIEKVGDPIIKNFVKSKTVELKIDKKVDAEVQKVTKKFDRDKL